MDGSEAVGEAVILGGKEAEFEFQWVPLEEINHFNTRPAFLKPKLDHLPHIVTN